MPFFSVIIPLYNKAHYIRRSLESVLGQTFVDFEVIVVDDGSTDDGGSIVSQYDDRRIRLIRQENAGECAARNRGVSEAESSWLAFLDADDEYLPDFLQKMHAAVIEQPEIGFAFSNVLYRGSSSGAARQMIPAGHNHFEIVDDYCDFLCRHSMEGATSSSVAIRKSVLIEVGCFPVGVTRGGDTVTWLRLGWSCKSGFEPSCQAIYHAEVQGSFWELSNGLPPKRKPPVYPDMLIAARDDLRKNSRLPMQMEASWDRCLRGYILGYIIELVRFGDRKQARRLFLKNIKWDLWWKNTAKIAITLLIPERLYAQRRQLDAANSLFRAALGFCLCKLKN